MAIQKRFKRALKNSLPLDSNRTLIWHCLVCFNIYLLGPDIQERRPCWKKNITLRYQRQRRWEDHHRRVEVTLEPTLCRAPWPTDTYTIFTNKAKNFNPTNYQIVNIQECSWKTKMYHLLTWRGLNQNSYGRCPLDMNTLVKCRQWIKMSFQFMTI